MPNLGNELTILNLESYRTRLMSRLSREDVINTLHVVNNTEVFADPPVFNINSFLHSDFDPAHNAELEAILLRYNASNPAIRSKP